MKKITHVASTNILGVFILLGFLCTPFLPTHYDSLSDLFHNMQNQWQNLTEWMSSGMMQPHRTQW